ncbi:hypothetical protein L1049_009600 [Liquidambar formosana]|uniref:Rhamnogalacturonan endolyase n=1 Tax=Liquidambar formosana TaxID=63359 RepID=A0AAP0R3J4_LIQFO
MALKCADYSVIHSSKDHLEVSFRSTYNPSTPGIRLPLSIDLRYIIRSGVSGFYSYAIYERPPGSPAFDLAQTRMVFALRRERFHYMAITDEKQRIMPMPEDRLPGRGKPLIVPESVLLINPINPDLKGEVDDKYQYSMDNKDGGVHGWISSGPFIGFWVIFPSHEFRNGGPTKQNLTNHTGPYCLAMLHGKHFIGEEILAHFEKGETWRKVFGPFFVYLNSTPKVSNAHNLWTDAKKQRLFEEKAWPYNFVSSPYYLTTQERGSASGRLVVQDRFVSQSLIPAKMAYIGLSAARTEGSWQTESKGFQFWVQTDSDGNFESQECYPRSLWTPWMGSETKLGILTYVPIRDGPTIWEIGFPDRTAIGYYVPNVNPMYANKLYLNSPEKYRQYGLWDRYTDMHPAGDQVFTIGVSDSKRDWFFAQFLTRIINFYRRAANNEYLPSTWTIKFNLDSVTSGVYKLRLAIASATTSDLKVHVNYMDVEHLVFQILNLGTDNTVVRHGIHGLYRLFSADVSSSLLVKGDNSMFLTQGKEADAICGILYDYIRLEAPATSERCKWSKE